MKLYLVEAPINSASPQEWARTWTVSSADAAKTRARYTADLGIARKDIRSTPVTIDTRKEGLLTLLNEVSNKRGCYFYPGA